MWGVTIELEWRRFLVGRIALAQKQKWNKVHMCIWHCHRQASANHEEAGQLAGAGQP